MQRRRTVFLLLAVAILVLGIVSRSVDLHCKLFNKYLGDALYAALFYVTLGMLFPRQFVRTRAIATSVFVVVVECFQLSGIPMQLRQQGGWMKLISISLGTAFSWFDILAYGVGIAVMVAIDAGWISRCESKLPSEK